jgi:hypothetical protein
MSRAIETLHGRFGRVAPRDIEKAPIARTCHPRRALIEVGGPATSDTFFTVRGLARWRS